MCAVVVVADVHKNSLVGLRIQRECERERGEELEWEADRESRTARVKQIY